jgi:hypothetical protein
MAKRILILLGMFIAAGALICPDNLSSCIFFPQTIFTSRLGPLDEPQFYRGHIDILQPHYRHIYLMAAYRYLAGIGLSVEDQKTLAVKPTGTDYWSDRDSPAIHGWLQVRVQVGAPPFDHIDRFKLVSNNSYILNCGDDAFRNAAATVVARSRSGASHEDLRAWVAAQDQVFANCAPPWPPEPNPPGPSIPAALPASAARWMQADRAYQIAAAEFYAGQFNAAAADFLRIADDHASPWYGMAPYLAARALIRKTTILDPTAAPAAQEQLRKVLADPDAAQWHESARGLAQFLRAQTEPAHAIDELAHAVATEKTGVAGAMNDYRIMLDEFSNRNQDAPRDEDITDWIVAMQNGPADHALDKWRTTRSRPWLVAALTYTSQPDAELMAAGAQVPETAPGFLTVQFHLLRLMPADEARPRLDAILGRKMPISARNLFLAERMRVARDWDDLLRYAPRTAAGSYVEGLGEQADTAPARYFDDDAARILNYQAPLAMLRLAASNPSLPSNLQLQVARVVWVRSILLNDTSTANGVAPVLASLAPDLKPYLDPYLSARDEKARGFAAAWLMLNNPGMRYSVDSGAGRSTPVPKIDDFRDNWWCAVDVTGRRMNAPLDLLYQAERPEARFLAAAQRAGALQEQKRLAASPSAPTFLARQAVEWAEAHADDPRVPEALHLSVRAAHYACGGDGESEGWEKRAYRLLHSRYANSDAARRTPFWYSVR